ncbi:GIY-YIG nuclease family protein [Maricaulis sp.]|uniref:GIY-YIG nuclease family protein n=1 Tax=Maricaulis sp. TaxID=1486257 RepID=UPI001B2D4B05|nr:GIY-YIG nuclease family protein [Maricaulis sp.]MBO6764036.1 GIY-YIG nuclease family protein [Maricaulis sp.]
MAKEFTEEDDALLAELGVEVEAKKAVTRTPREERIIAGFEEIQRFVEEHDRVPQHGEERDIFERLYAVRLDRIRKLEECRALVEPMDHQGLLAGTSPADSPDVEELDDDALLRELGVESETASITELRHVRSAAEKRAAEEIANREKCEDFERFKPLFEAVQTELDQGVRITRQIRKDAGFLKTDISQGQFFILGGQVAYVAEVGKRIKAPNGEFDARLRVIYSNGTESNLLLRSLQRALYKDETSRSVSEPSAGPLFGGEQEEEDLASGTIYVLRSKSSHPVVAENREVLHKIGVTGGSVEKRIANASKDATYLLADVEVVATYELFNINRKKFERLMHRVFEPAQLKIDIKDRFGNPVAPREWFLVPLFVIDEAIEKFKDGTIGEYVYDPESASLKEAS